MIRKHVKVEPARWYYHCDKLGMLVWQDIPNGDKSADWHRPSGYDGREMNRTAQSAHQFYMEWKEIMDAFYHFPSIVMWVPFNEAWGELVNSYQKLIDKIPALIKKGLAAAIYTQTTDVEGEVNGLMTYDREIIKMDPGKVKEINSQLYEVE